MLSREKSQTSYTPLGLFIVSLITAITIIGIQLALL